MLHRILLFTIFIVFATKDIIPTNIFGDFSNSNSFIIPKDLSEIPQNSQSIVNNQEKIPKEYRIYKADLQSKFKEHVTRPWSTTYSRNDVIKQNFLSFQNRNECRDFAYRPYKIDVFLHLNQNAEDFKILDVPAIMTSSTDLRGIPTNLPCLHPDKAGGEYPFDMLQYSRMYVGFPIKVVAVSQDKEWYLIYSCENSMGWIKAGTFALLSPRNMNFFKKTELRTIVKDEGNLKIGMFFPKNTSSASSEVLMPQMSKSGKLIWRKTSLKTSSVSDFSRPFRIDLVASVINELLDKSYGWGGLHGYRDCSALLRDYFTTLGIYLPRNSQMQINFKSKIDDFSMIDFTDKKKLSFIKKYGVPFRTVIYFPGHIMLYVGEYRGDPAILHSMWGQKIIKNDGREGRNVIGKSVISTLQIGKEISGLEKTLLNKVTKMAIF